MNLAEIIEAIKDVSEKASTNDLDNAIRNAINRAYRKLCRTRTFGQLLVRGESFTTVADTFSYVLPYPLDRIINDSLRYDLSDTLPGVIIELRDSGDVTRTIASALYGQGSWPATASISSHPPSGAVITPLYLEESTASIAGGAFGYVSPNAVADWVGRYIRFVVDVLGSNPGDYGYRIASFDAGTGVLVLEIPYSGPTVKLLNAQVQPVNSQWLTFDPSFVDTPRTVTYDWYSKPRRLYDKNDVPEISELSDAIVWQVLADNPIYHRPKTDDFLNYRAKVREEMVSAFKAGLQ